MFSLSNIKLALGAFVVGMLVVATALIYFLFCRLNDTKEDLFLAQSQLEVQVEINSKLLEDIVDVKDSYKSLIEKNVENETALEKLRNKFANDGKGWEHIIEAKPKLVEKIINNATDMRMRCFEIASGAALTEDEKNGTVKNTVCPQLLVVE